MVAKNNKAKFGSDPKKDSGFTASLIIFIILLYSYRVIECFLMSYLSWKSRGNRISKSFWKIPRGTTLIAKFSGKHFWDGLGDNFSFTRFYTFKSFKSLTTLFATHKNRKSEKDKDPTWYYNVNVTFSKELWSFPMERSYCL